MTLQDGCLTTFDGKGHAPMPRCQSAALPLRTEVLRCHLRWRIHIVW